MILLLITLWAIDFQVPDWAVPIATMIGIGLVVALMIKERKDG